MRLAFRIGLVAAALWLLATVTGAYALPSLLLAAPMPNRTDAERAAILETLRPPDARWTTSSVGGARGD